MTDTATALVVNSGSSSVKYQVITFPSEAVLDKGQRDRVGVLGGDFATHTDALADVLDALPESIQIDFVGHRVVHGGESFQQPVVIDADVIAAVEQLSVLAPLHNPPNVAGIRAAVQVMPNVPHIAVFDTAFFATMSPAVYTYALPHEVAQTYGLRKYGFHGTSHQFVTEELETLSRQRLPERRVVSFHLGNGSSVSAVKGGLALDTSMGFTPLAGLVMGTRSGDLDPAIPIYLQTAGGMSADDVDRVLNRESGLLGLSGHSDMRDLFAAAQAGDANSERALEVWVWRARHYLGAYMAHLGGLDAVVFTGGIGENQAELRRRILHDLEGFGIHLADVVNESSAREPRMISSTDSRVEVWVIPTKEELQIARLSYAVVTAQR